MVNHSINKIHKRQYLESSKLLHLTFTVEKNNKILYTSTKKKENILVYGAMTYSQNDADLTVIR